MVIRSQEDDPSQVVLQIDFSSAFNSVHWATFVAATEKYLPDLVAWIWWTYDTWVELIVSSPDGPQTILSEEVCQQGDLLGPLMFCLAIHELIVDISWKVPGLHLNDRTLVGPSTEVLKALDLLEPGAVAIGLHLNRTKLVLYWPHPSKTSGSTRGTPPPGGVVDPPSRGSVPGMDESIPERGARAACSGLVAPPKAVGNPGFFEFSEAAPISCLTSHDPFAETFARSPNGVMALGAPIMPRQVHGRKLGDHLCKAWEALRHLPLLDDSQVALLRSHSPSSTTYCWGGPRTPQRTCSSRHSQAHQRDTEQILSATLPVVPLHSDPKEPLAQLASSLRTVPDQVEGKITESGKQREISALIDASEVCRL
jgi:hypothetical protein